MAGIIHILKFISNNPALKQDRAQYVAEYAVLISLVIVAVMGMSLYLQRGVQARYRAAVLNMRKELRTLKGNPTLNIFYDPYERRVNIDSAVTYDETTQYHPILSMPGETRMQRDTSSVTKINQETLPGNYAD